MPQFADAAVASAALAASASGSASACVFARPHSGFIFMPSARRESDQLQSAQRGQWGEWPLAIANAIIKRIIIWKRALSGRLDVCNSILQRETMLKCLGVSTHTHTFAFFYNPHTHTRSSIKVQLTLPQPNDTSVCGSGRGSCRVWQQKKNRNEK